MHIFSFRYLLSQAFIASVAGYGEAIPSDRLGIRGVSGSDVDLADGTVSSSGGPYVNQMRWYCLRASVARMVSSVC